MSPGLQFILLSVALPVLAIFLIMLIGRAFARLAQGSAHGRAMFRLSHVTGTPSVHVEADLVVHDARTFFAKRRDLPALLESIALRPACAGAYDDLVREMDDALERLRTMPADHEQADVLDVAAHLRMRIHARLRERFDPELKAYGVRVGLLTRCAIGTAPPVGPPEPPPPVGQHPVQA
jgi:hypothetical protein